MMEYEVTIKPELIKYSGIGCDPIDEVRDWLRENKMFGWHTSLVTTIVPMKQTYYICFNNTTDAMLFTLRWS